jgi:hypothetical protein
MYACESGLETTALALLDRGAGHEATAGGKGKGRAGGKGAGGKGKGRGGGKGAYNKNFGAALGNAYARGGRGGGRGGGKGFGAELEGLSRAEAAAEHEGRQQPRRRNPWIE